MAWDPSLFASLLGSNGGPGALTPTLQSNPDADQQRRQMAQALMKGSSQPIRSPWQGAAELVDGLTGGVESYVANRNAAQGAASAASAFGAYPGAPSRPFGFGSVKTPPDFSATPAGQGASAPASTPYQADAAPIFAGLTSGGLSPMAAAGVLGNFKQESNFSSDTRGGGDNGTAHGLGQWRLERWDNLQNYAAQRGADVNDPRLQTQFALDESKGIKLPDGRSVYDAVNQAQTPQEAAMLWGKYFERPKIVEPIRAAHAANYYAQFGQGGAQPRGVQLAGPVPTADTGAPPVTLAPQGGRSGAIAPQGAPTAADVADAQAILADPVSPGNARKYAQGVLDRAGGGAQASAAAPVDPEQARWRARTSPPGGPAIPASGAPMPPPRPDFSAAAAAPPQVAANFRPMLTPAGPQQAQQAPQNPLVAALMGLVGGGGQTVPDGRGGYVPASNSRYDPATGNFLPGGGGPPPGNVPFGFGSIPRPNFPAPGGPSPTGFAANPQPGNWPPAQPQGGQAPAQQPAGSSLAADPQMSWAMGVLSNPYSNPAQRQIAAAVFSAAQKRQEEAGRYSQVNDADGNVWSVDNFTGQRTVALKKDGQTADVQNYEYAKNHGFGGSFADWETQVKKAGATNVSTNVDLAGEKTEDQEMGRAAAKRADDMISGAMAAPGKLARLAQMRAALSNVPTGPGADIMGSAVGWARAAGVSDDAMRSLGLDPNLATAKEVSSKIVAELVTESIGKGGFPANNFSDADRQFLVRKFPSLLNQPGSNEIVLDTLNAIEQRKVDMADAWDAFRADQQQAGKPARFADFEGAWRRGAGKQNVLSPIIEKMNAGGYAGFNPQGVAQPAASAQQPAPAASPGGPPPGAPAGTRQAPDGQWYAPDPARPGKYLQVR